MKSFWSLPSPAPNASGNERQIYNHLRGVYNGKLDVTRTLTLRPVQTTTTFSDERINTDTFIAYMPITTTAGTEKATSGLPTVCSKGSAIVTHANNSLSDRNYVVAIFS